MNINSCHILLKNVLFFAHHGVAPQETVTGNEFYINLRLKTDFKHAAVTDELGGHLCNTETGDGNTVQIIRTCMRTYRDQIISRVSGH